MQEITNTVRRHEVLVQPREGHTQPIHPRRPRQPGRACKTDPIKWKDRKKLAIENFKNEWHALKELGGGQEARDAAEAEDDETQEATTGKSCRLHNPFSDAMCRSSCACPCLPFATTTTTTCNVGSRGELTTSTTFTMILSI